MIDDSRPKVASAWLMLTIFVIISLQRRDCCPLELPLLRDQDLG